MNLIRNFLIAAAVAVSSTAVFAQQGGGKGPGPGPQASGPAGSAPGMGMGMGMGPGGRGGRWGSDYTHGWEMMTQQERDAHRERMGSMQTYEDCTAYRKQQHDLMAARAKERGKALGQPRQDACGGLKR